MTFALESQFHIYLPCLKSVLNVQVLSKRPIVGAFLLSDCEIFANLCLKLYSPLFVPMLTAAL